MSHGDQLANVMFQISLSLLRDAASDSDNREAAQSFKAAADQCNAAAQLNCGICSENGGGILLTL